MLNPFAPPTKSPARSNGDVISSDLSAVARVPTTLAGPTTGIKKLAISVVVPPSRAKISLLSSTVGATNFFVSGIVINSKNGAAIPPPNNSPAVTTPTSKSLSPGANALIIGVSKKSVGVGLGNLPV